MDKEVSCHDAQAFRCRVSPGISSSAATTVRHVFMQKKTTGAILISCASRPANMGARSIVRANLVEHPAEYPWSSYPANGQGGANRLLTPRHQYLELAPDPESRRCAYRGLFRSHTEPLLVEEIRAATNGNYALGNDRFRKEIEQALGRRAVPGAGATAWRRRATINVVCPGFARFAYNLRRFLPRD